MIWTQILVLVVFETTDPTVTETQEIDKKIIYKKETTVDLSGSTVDGDSQQPPAFFVTKMQTPNAKSLLEEQLKFKIRDYNFMGQ